MAKGRFVPDFSGYRAVLDSGEMQGELDRIADRCETRANQLIGKPEGYRLPDFESGEFTIKTGSSGRYIRTKTDHARYSQNRNKTLSKAFNYATGG